MVKWKINYTLTIKSPTSAVKSITPSFYLQMISRTQREREREREHRGPKPISPQLHPFNNEREMQLHPTYRCRSEVPTLRWAAPSYQIHSTSPPSTLSSRCTQSTKAKLSLTLVKPISLPTSPIRHSHVASEKLLSNPPSTIPNPPKTNPPKTNLDLDPPKTDLVDLISNSFPVYLSFPQSLTLSSSISLSLTEFNLWMNGANGFLFW